MPWRPSSAAQRSISSRTSGSSGWTDMKPMRRSGAAATNSAVESLMRSGSAGSAVSLPGSCTAMLKTTETSTPAERAAASYSSHVTVTRTSRSGRPTRFQNTPSSGTTSRWVGVWVWMSTIIGVPPASPDAVVLDAIRVELDAETRALGRARTAALDGKRLREEHVLVQERAQDVAGKGIGGQGRQRHPQVDHGGRGDPQLAVAADRAGHPGRARQVRDLPRHPEAGALPDVDRQRVGGLGADQGHGVEDGLDALVGHDRDPAARADGRHPAEIPACDRL